MVHCQAMLLKFSPEWGAAWGTCSKLTTRRALTPRPRTLCWEGQEQHAPEEAAWDDTRPGEPSSRGGAELLEILRHPQGQLRHPATHALPAIDLLRFQ